MKYRKTINEMNRQKQREQKGVVDDDENKYHFVHVEKQKRPIRNWTKAVTEHLDEAEDYDEFYGK